MKNPPTSKWGVNAELRPLLGGHRNAAFRTFGLETELVFKSTRRSHDAVTWLLSVHDFARQSGFVVPQLIESKKGRFVEHGWTCEAFIEGVRFQPSELPSLLSKIEVFHEATSNMAQRPGFLCSKSLLQASSGGDIRLEAMPGELSSLCRLAWQAVCHRQQAIVHGDLNAGNLLRTSTGDTALLDWDECRRDLVLYDLGQLQADDDAARKARVAWEVACSWELEPEHAKEVAKLFQPMAASPA